MSDANNNLTFRFNVRPREPMRHSAPTPPQSGYRYHWGRIVTACTVAVVLLGLLISALIPAAPESETATIASADSESPGVESPGVESPGVESPGVESPGVEPVRRGNPGDDTAASGVVGAAAMQQAVEPTVDVAVAAASLPAEEPRGGVKVHRSAQAKGAESAVETTSGELPATSESPSGRPYDSLLAPGETRILSDSVARFRLTNALRAKEPVGGLQDITLDRPATGTLGVFAFSDVRGRAGETLVYRWLRDGQVAARVRVGVGSDRWRSSSSKVINNRMRGPWRVELTTGDGELLAFSEFAY